MDKKESFFTAPNFLSIIRIILIIPFAKFILEEKFLRAVWIFIFSSLTDFFDGLIARKYGQQTSIGEILDPFADKLTVLVTMICIAIRFSKIVPFMLIMIVKELLMIIFAVWLIKNNLKPIKAKWYGKLGTVFFYFSISLIVAFKALWGVENEFLIFSFMVITSLLMLNALLRYFFVFIKLKNDMNRNLNKM